MLSFKTENVDVPAGRSLNVVNAQRDVINSFKLHKPAVTLGGGRGVVTPGDCVGANRIVEAFERDFAELLEAEYFSLA